MEAHVDGPGYWHLQKVADENPVAPGAPFRAALIHQGSHSTTNLLRFTQGGVLKPHFHREHDEIAYVVQGEAQFRLGDRLIDVAAGDVMITPAGTVHAALAKSSDLLVLAIFVPDFDSENPDRIFIDD